MQNSELIHKSITLLPHDNSWDKTAENVIDRLRARLGDVALDIRHIGSTAIPTIAADPVIDIAIACTCDPNVIISALAESEFKLCRDIKSKDELLFVYHDKDSCHTPCRVHAVDAKSDKWRDYNLFCDFLISYPEAAKFYEKKKVKLCGSDRETYIKSRSETINYLLRKALVWSYLGKDIHIEIDRPIGYIHKKEKYSLTYPINYGYIPGVLGGDGEELDVYLVGVSEHVTEYDARVIAIVQRKNDIEDKLIAAPKDMEFTDEELRAATHFQEQYYDDVISKEFVPVLW